MNNFRGFSFKASLLSSICIILLFFLLPSLALAQGSASGNELFKGKCAICHSIDRALNRFDPSENWEKVVTRERAKAPFWISAEEGRTITAYLESRDKIVSSGRPDLMPEAMAARQSLIVVEPASRMHDNISDARFTTAVAAYAANELLLSGVPFFEKITQTPTGFQDISSRRSQWNREWVFTCSNPSE